MARANFFPRFTLIAIGGTQDTGFRLFNPGNTFGAIGPSVDLPLFDAGLRQAELEVAKAGFTEAAENYRATVLGAVRDVQDASSALRWLAAEWRQSSTAATAARQAADLSLTLYRDGASSYLDVVTAQSTALDAERLTIALHTRELESEVGLMLALGGGWSAPTSFAPRTIDITPPPSRWSRRRRKAGYDRCREPPRKLRRLCVLAQASRQRRHLLPLGAAGDEPTRDGGALAADVSDRRLRRRSRSRQRLARRHLRKVLALAASAAWPQSGQSRGHANDVVGAGGTLHPPRPSSGSRARPARLLARDPGRGLLRRGRPAKDRFVGLIRILE